jgi:hypothetical protein
VAIVHRRYRRDGATPASGVFGGAVAPAEEAAPLGSALVLAGSIRRMSGAPGSIVGSIGHRSDTDVVEGRPFGAAMDTSQ